MLGEAVQYLAMVRQKLTSSFQGCLRHFLRFYPALALTDSVALTEASYYAPGLTTSRHCLHTRSEAAKVYGRALCLVLFDPVALALPEGTKKYSTKHQEVSIVAEGLTTLPDTL